MEDTVYNIPFWDSEGIVEHYLEIHYRHKMKVKKTLSAEKFWFTYNVPNTHWETNRHETKVPMEFPKELPILCLQVVEENPYHYILKVLVGDHIFTRIFFKDKVRPV